MSTIYLFGTVGGCGVNFSGAGASDTCTLIFESEPGEAPPVSDASALISRRSWYSKAGVSYDAQGSDGEISSKKDMLLCRGRPGFV